MKTIGTYKRGLRHLAKRLKDGKPSAIQRAAALFAEMLPANAQVIPMPSHNGMAEVMLQVANTIKQYRADICVCDILRCEPHKGMYNTKKQGLKPFDPIMSFIGEKTIIAPCIIDNVIDTGMTFNAALKILPNAELFTIATTNNRRQYENHY